MDEPHAAALLLPIVSWKKNPMMIPESEGLLRRSPNRPAESLTAKSKAAKTETEQKPGAKIGLEW